MPLLYFDEVTSDEVNSNLPMGYSLVTSDNANCHRYILTHEFCHFDKLLNSFDVVAFATFT